MPTLDKPYIKIYHNSPEIRTVGDFVSNDSNSIVSSFIDRESDFLAYKGDTPLTNRSRILRQYTAKEAQDAAGKSDAELLLKLGTELLLPKSEIQLQNAFAVSLEPYDTSDFNAFVTNTLRQLLENPNYKSISKSGANSKFVDIYPQISVWCWVRSINAYIDVSPFVQQVNVSSTEAGSTFNLILAPIEAERENEEWVIKKSSIANYNSGALSDNYSAKTKLFKLRKDPSRVLQNDFYFHNIFSPNDLIFIRFETLSLEAQDRKKEDRKFTVSSNDIPNKVYDLIGMVDNSGLTVQPQSAEISISVAGRDLTKTIIDDGSYFYIEEYVANIFANKERSKKLRNRIYGRLVTFQTLGVRSIQQSINLVINAFSATGYVPDEIFSGYGDRRNRIIQENTEARDAYADQLDNYRNSSLVAIELSRQKYKLPNPADPQLLQSTFNVITELLEQSELVEEELDNLSRTALERLDGKLFDRAILPSNLAEDVAGTAIGEVNAYTKYKARKPQSFVEEGLKSGVWQIIDVEVDSSVANIRLADSSISEANGSLINTLRSFCQPPFVEFFTDTYGDRFKLIARRPPFNQKAYTDLAEVCSEITIAAEDILSMNLAFDDSEVYSYYLLRPKAFLGGTSDGLSLAFLPAIVFEEYVDMFGARPYDQVSNYLPFAPKDGENKVNVEKRQIVRDLKFMIDSTIYIPFTRKGTIVINGQRNIKKKTIVYNELTDELCYVDNVEHSYVQGGGAIDSTTTLSVSRCMVKRFTKPVNVDGVENPVSYFNIVQTVIDEKVFLKSDKQLVEVLENWDLTRTRDGVADVFNFFVGKRQFE